MTTTLELFDFGIDVRVLPPPATAQRDGAPLLAALRKALPQPSAAPAAPAAPKPTPTPSPTPR